MEAMRTVSDKLLNLSQNVSASVPNHLDAGMVVMLGTGVVLIAGAWAVVLTIAAAARPKVDAQSGPNGSRAAGE